jgi:hypothetical protein
MFMGTTLARQSTFADRHPSSTTRRATENTSLDVILRASPEAACPP